MRSFRGLKKTFLRILLVVAVIAVLNFIGLRLYSLMTGYEVLPSAVFIVEGFVIVILGVLSIDTEDILLSRAGWLGYVTVGVRNVQKEFMKKRPRQLSTWLQLIIIGLILLITGLLLFSSS